MDNFNFIFKNLVNFATSVDNVNFINDIFDNYYYNHFIKVENCYFSKIKLKS